MKIVICASMAFAKEIVEGKTGLEKMGHEVVVPENMELHLEKTLSSSESTEEKIKDDLIRRYFNKIKDGDAVLVLNYEKNGIENYVGGNTFLEMGFAYILEKPIYLLNEIPEVSYKDEIVAMQPLVLHGNLEMIKSKF